MQLDWSQIVPNMSFLLGGMMVTLQITLTAILVGILLGTLLAVMRIANSRLLRAIASVYVTVFRSIPLIMVLLFFYLVVPQLLIKVFDLPPDVDIRLVTALIAFSLFEAAYYSEIIRAGIQSISRGQLHASFALGFSKFQTLRIIILPQAFRMIIPMLLTQCFILFQDTTLVYVLGLSDFFYRSVSIVGETSGTSMEMIIFAGCIYFVICFLTSHLIAAVKKNTPA